MVKLYKNRFPINIQKLGVGLLFALGGIHGLDAQVSNYTFSQTNGVYTPITGGINMELAATATSGFDSQYFHNGTDGINGTTTTASQSGFPIGFDFNYNGTNYDGFFISTDGSIRLTSTSPVSAGTLSTLPISSNTATIKNIIAAFAADLSGGLRVGNSTRTSGSPIFTLGGTSVAAAGNIRVGMRIVGTGIPAGTTVVAISGNEITMSNNATTSSSSATVNFVEPDNISYITTGAPGSRVLTVQWKNCSRYSGYGDALNFQIKLFEGTNAIQVIYDNTASSLATLNSTIQVGLKGEDNRDFNSRTGSWAASSPSTVNNGNLNFSGPANSGGQQAPVSGLTYTWNPPAACSSIPVAGTISPASQTLLQGQPSATLNLSGYSSGVSSLSFQWQVSTDNTNFSNVTDGTGGTTASYTPIAFDGVTKYYRCVVTCTATNQSSMSSSVVIEGCAPSLDFSQNFDSVTPQAFPPCWAKIGTTGSAYTQAIATMSAPNALYMYSSSTSASSLAHVSMPPVSTLQSGLYQLRFKLRANTSVGGNIQVGYLAIPGDVASFVSIGSNYTATSITQPVEYIIRSINAPAGVTSLVFKHTGSPANSLFIDDVFYELMPTCIEPTAVSTVSTTATSANLTWAASITVPSNGYQVYYTTTNTPPVATTVLDATNSATTATTSIQLTGLQSATEYYAWVRSVCSSTDSSDWTPTSLKFRTECQPPVVTASNVTFCPGMTATLTASSDVSSATINWYDSATSTTPIATGATFTTPSLNAATNYYVGASTGSPQTVGPVAPSSLTSVSSTSYPINTYHQIFNVVAPLVINSIDVFPTSSTPIGTTASIEIQDSTGAVLVNVPYTVTANDGVTPNTVNINYSIMPGTGYKIGQGAPSINLNRNTGGATYPYVYNGIEITGNNFSSGANYWYYIYNWQVTNACESVRQMVTATPDATACLGTSEVGAKKEEIKLYPNPFTDKLNISDIKNVKSVNIVDLSGKVIRTIDKPSAILELSDLISGMYMVIVNKIDGSNQAIKVIKK